MDLIKILFTSYLIAFSGAMVPGPLLTITISKTAEIGFKAGPILILGHGILELILIIIITMGAAPFLQNNTVLITIAFIGSTFLMIMAIGMLKSIPNLTLDLTKKENEKENSNIIMSGALLSLANPYWIIWWATIGLGYILVSQKFGLLGIIIFFIGHIMGDLTWYSIISYTITKGEKFFTDKTYKILIGTCGIFLIFFAVSFIYYGIGKL
jgi:threonine/homoserine/homoserine lactone efflux protein